MQSAQKYAKVWEWKSATVWERMLKSICLLFRFDTLDVLDHLRGIQSGVATSFYAAIEPCRNQVSISPTFYEQLFRRKVFWAAFLYLRLRFVFFWQKEIGKKAACKMLVKLTAARPSPEQPRLVCLAVRHGFETGGWHVSSQETTDKNPDAFHRKVNAFFSYLIHAPLLFFLSWQLKYDFLWILSDRCWGNLNFKF